MIYGTSCECDCPYKCGNKWAVCFGYCSRSELCGDEYSDPSVDDELGVCNCICEYYKSEMKICKGICEYYDTNNDETTIEMKQT